MWWSGGGQPTPAPAVAWSVPEVPPTTSRMEYVVPATSVETVVSLCKRRGFVFPCGEIYGGTRSAWDYGPLGVELKENVKRQWWKGVVQLRDDVVGIDSSIIVPPQTWEASGRVDTFSDPLRSVEHYSE